MSPIPDPEDPSVSAAFVEPDGTVKVKPGIKAPEEWTGVVGFVPGMCMLWHGLAADCPQGWEIVDAPGRYIRTVTADGEVGTTGGSDTHVHSSPLHTHGYNVDHDHPNPTATATTNVSSHEMQAGSTSTPDPSHTHAVAIPNFTATKTTDPSSAANTGGTLPADLPSWYGLWLIKYTGAPKV